MSELAPPHSTIGRGEGLAPASPATIANGADRDEVSSVYLHAGQIFVSVHPSVVTTILGSCVSVCLWDRVVGIGGINHYVMAVGNGRRSGDVGRFGHLAIPRLIDGMIGVGSRKPDLVAKVFGGANVIGAIAGGKNHVGTKNVEQALAMLETEGIPVVAQDVGGSRGRKLIFNTQDGVARVRKL